MPRTDKITISLPKDLLQEIERQCAARGESRSQFLRMTVEAYLHRERERELVKQYVQGYQEMPETEDEVALAQAMAQMAFGDNPWEAGGEQ